MTAQANQKTAQYRRYRSAIRCYGQNLTGLLVPQPAPLSVRLNLAELINRDARRCHEVRALVPRILHVQTAEGVARRSRSAERSRLLLHFADQTAVADAGAIVQHHHNITNHLQQRVGLLQPHIAEGSPPIYAWHFIATELMIFLACGIDSKTASPIALAVLAASIAYYVATHAGWKYGYNQAVWHCAEAAIYADKDGAEVRAAQAARRMAINLRTPTGEGYLYVVEFSTGTVKVGQTEDPARRLGTHRAEAAAFGVTVVNYWISPAHINFRDNETKLINQCLKVSTRTRREYFHNVHYRTAVQLACGLTYHSSRTDGTSIEGAWR